MIRRHGGADVPTIGELLDAARRAGHGVIALGPQACGSLEEAASREWLVADGLGGYAMGTVAGLRTRRYHGLLVPAARRAVRPDARPRGARARPRRRRRALPARDRRMGLGRSRPARPRAPRLLRPRPRRAALALAGRQRRPRARGRDGAWSLRRRRRAPPRARRPAGRARAHAALHVAERPRRAVRGRRPRGRGDGRRIRLRGRLPRRGGGLAGRAARGTAACGRGRRPPAG